MASVIYTVYQFCNVDHFLFGGTPAYTVLDSLDAAIPWLFVLWGFTLCELPARCLVEGRPLPALRRFVVPGVTRLLPTYVIAVIVVWLPRQHSLPGDWHDLLEHLTFTQVFDRRRIFYTIGPAWAISVGAIFALLVIIAMRVLPSAFAGSTWSRRRRVRVAAVSIAGVALVSPAWDAWSYGVRHRPTQFSFTTWFGPVANVDSFAAGMAAALVAAVMGRRRLSGQGAGLLRLGSAALIVIAFVIREPQTWSTVWFAPVCSLGFCGLVAAGALGPSRGSPKLATAAEWLGTCWLGMFLWSEPIMLALRTHGVVHQSPGSFGRDLTVVLLASAVAGWLTLVGIQRPLSQLADNMRQTVIDLRDPSTS